MINEQVNPIPYSRRDRTEILMDVLKTLREHPYRLTRIMYKANLSHAKGKECIATLMKQDFVNISGFKVVSGMESPVYYITDKGLLHLQKYEEFIRGTKQ